MMTRRTRDWSDEVKVGTSADLTNDAAGVSHSIELIVNSICMIAIATSDQSLVRHETKQGLKDFASQPDSIVY